MASSARIDELRKKFDENPRRYFAPLANEYRKVGDLEQAIFICQEYLPQQPGHMSGHIVYGQALFESGRHEEARAVFETALTLDPENLIALRHLGDIARASGDPTAARSWYQRVLEADPRNEEIGTVLKELGSDAPPVAASGGAPSEGAPPAEEAVEPWARAESSMNAQTAPSAELVQADAPTLEIEQTPDAAQWGMIEPATPPEPAPVSEVVETPSAASDELLDIDDFNIGGAAVPPDAVAEAPSTAESSQRAEPAPELQTVDDAALAFEADPYAIAAKPLEPEPAEPAEPPSVTQETAATAEALLDEAAEFELPAVESAADLVPETASTPADEARDATETPPASEAMRATPSAPTGMFVTETMAQLYLKQGHFEAAVDTYRQLVANRPDDAGLRSRLEEAERQLHGPVPTAAPTAAPTATPAATPTATPGEELPEAAAEDFTSAASEAGPTIREFLAGLFGGVDPMSAAAPMPEPAAAPVPEPVPALAPEPATAASTPSATAGASLDALFSGLQPSPSDETAAAALARAFAPEPQENLPLKGLPARRAADELSLGHVFKSRTPARGTTSDFSFDQFFTDEMSQAPTAISEGPAAAPSSSDDVAQFSAWLNGLKKT